MRRLDFDGARPEFAVAKGCPGIIDHRTVVLAARLSVADHVETLDVEYVELSTRASDQDKFANELVVSATRIEASRSRSSSNQIRPF